MPEPTIHEKVIVRAVKDGAFRERLLSDPRAVLVSEYNIQLPEQINVCVLEESPNTLSIVLPSPEEAMQELSDEDLEAVAGGQWVVIAWTFICYTVRDV